MVYFLLSEGTGLIKIGAAVDVQARIAKLQTGSSSELRLLKVVPDTSGVFLERLYHHRWAAQRARGEWFHPSSDMLAFIADDARAALGEPTALVL